MNEIKAYEVTSYWVVHKYQKHWVWARNEEDAVLQASSCNPNHEGETGEQWIDDRIIQLDLNNLPPYVCLPEKPEEAP